MKKAVLVTSCLLLAVCGCSSKPANPTAPSTTASSSRAYNGTASVGDFMTIALDAGAHTIHYENHSNGDSATVPYTVNTDGTYTLDDATGNLVAAYEVPDFVLMIQAAKTGPDHNTPSLITAVRSAPISISSIANHGYNFMQFRTNSGGLEIGAVTLDGSANVDITRYWPFGAMGTDSPFHDGRVNDFPFEPDSSGTFMRLPDGAGGNDYAFGTPNGVFAVDTNNGAILSFVKAASKDWNPANAGTYKTIFYHKTGAHMSGGNVETGTATQESGTITIDASGNVTVLDGAGGTLATGTLSPVADVSYLEGSGKLSDPCNGLFTLRVATVVSQQDVFCTFLNGAVLFSSFECPRPLDPGNTYEYFYGCGLK